MYKKTLLALTLAAALSMSACTASSGNKTKEDDTTVAKEIQTTAISDTDTASTTQSVTEQITETAPPDKPMSDKDKLIRDIIAEYSNSYDTTVHDYRYDGNTLICSSWYLNRNNKPCGFTCNTDTGEVKKLDGYAFCGNDRLYYIYPNTYNGIFTVSDFSGGNSTSFDTQAFGAYILDDGRLIFQSYKDELWKIASADFKNVVALPDYTEDIGHGMTETVKINTLYFIYDKKAYASFDTKGGRIYKAIDLNTLEMTEPEEKYLTLIEQGPLIYIGKYFADSSQKTIYDMDTGEIYTNVFNGMGTKFFTDTSLYYTDYSKLYKYISEDNSELIYDGSKNQAEFFAVSDEFFVVKDDVGVFLVNMKNGEEKMLDINFD